MHGYHFLHEGRNVFTDLLRSHVPGVGGGRGGACHLDLLALSGRERPRAREGVTVRRPGSQLHSAADLPCGLSELLFLTSQPLSTWRHSHLSVHLTLLPWSLGELSDDEALCITELPSVDRHSSASGQFGGAKINLLLLPLPHPKLSRGSSGRIPQLHLLSRSLL